MGPPVSVTVWPRTRPSVESMAMQRMVFSPRCWAASSTSRRPSFSVSSAFRIGGSSPSNCTSTTAPSTCEILPIALVADWVLFAVLVAMECFPAKEMRSISERSGRRPGLEGLGAGDDLDQLLGDGGLTRPVVGQRQLVDHLAGVARSEEHTSELQSLMRISYAVFCLKKKKITL